MREEIESLFVQNVASIIKNHQRSEESSIIIVEEIIRERLEEALLDSSHLSFVDFSKKYLSKPVYFEYKDFTCAEIRAIIAETPLTERDRHLAALRYIDLKTEEEIADILQIDKKTVHSNIPKVSCALKRTASMLHGKK